ncbi:MAG: restriction endonuclease subunit S [Salinivirgaceae bacterium]|nr:restriction endonuclease subunit S [Salinivirgaceae bacterium]
MSNYPTYKLGQICETTSGGTPNRKNDAYYGGYIPWVKSGELGKGTIYDTEEKITEEAVKESSAKIFPKGTLLIALYGATIGKLGFLGVPAATNQAVCGIFENEKIDLQFLSYYLFHKRNDLIAQGTGGAQPNISQTILKNLSIPLPPLATQHQIVSRIETLFAELDKAEERLRTAQQQLKTYKQAVLNHWLNNDEGKWETVKLGEVLQKIEAGKSFRCNEKVPALHEKGIVKISAVTWGEFMEDECKTIINEELYNPKYRIHKGDLLMSRANTIQLVGNCVLVKEEPRRDILLSDKVLRLVLCDEIDSNYILYSLKTSNCRNQIQIMSTGNQDSMRNIGQDRIKKIEIPLPPLSEQQRIVEEIESRLSQASKSSACIEEALQQTEALRQSILKKAFSGELVVSTSSTTTKGG